MTLRRERRVSRNFMMPLEGLARARLGWGSSLGGRMMLELRIWEPKAWGLSEGVNT